MRRVMTAIAAIALITGGAYAQGNGKGGGNDKGGSMAAAAQKGGGQGKGQGQAKGQGKGNAGAEKAGQGGPSMAQSMRESDNRGNGNAMRAQDGERGNGQQAARNNDRGNGNRELAGDRGRGNDNRAAANDRGRGNDNRTVVVDRRDGRFDDGRDVVRINDLGSRFSRGLIDGCPPGLAKKNPPCVPPGQVRQTGLFSRYDRPDFWGLRGLTDGRYFYNDGYLMRLGGDGRIGGYIPLLGGALGIGNAWPSYYEPVRLPGYYESYYDLGPYEGYRYADNVIYRIDPETSAITSIAALLTGDQFAIGQPLPLGYDVYNVPYAYRDRYYDSPDALYRYSDGYVYEVDPTTRLIAAVIELVAS